MARGRHVKRSGLLARLSSLAGFPAGRPHRRRRRPSRHVAVPVDRSVVDRLAALEGEVSRLRVLGIAHAAAAASADVRARRAEEQLVAAREELAATGSGMAALRSDLAALREELVWAFAERRLPVEAPAPVVGLRDASAQSA